MQRYWILVGVLLSSVLPFLSGCSSNAASGKNGVTFTTPYQAVLLSNNSVYYGKLTGYGTSNPVLTDVYYVVTKTDPNTNQVQNVLVKRGKELHSPDRMYLNPSSIVFVEPVSTDSRVAQLISEASKQ